MFPVKRNYGYAAIFEPIGGLNFSKINIYFFRLYSELFSSINSVCFVLFQYIDIDKI